MNKKSSTLALLGGNPVRTRDFPPVPFLDGHEEQIVEKILRSKKLSCHIGSTSSDIENLLSLPSVEAAEAPLNDFNFLGGPMVRQLEAGFARLAGTSHAIAVNSATSGLSLAIGACRLEPGDEVLTTCMSFSGSAASILTFGNVPRFSDISPENYCIGPREIEKAISPRTRAILVVHLFGYAAEMDSILDLAHKRNIVVIEDCAQALGTQYKGRAAGTMGRMGVYSLNHPKNITSGEGGIVVTNDAALARHIRLTRNHGEVVPDDSWSGEDLVNVVGFNMRMTEITAGIGLVQLDKLQANNSARNENFLLLARGIAGIPHLTFRNAASHTDRVVHVCPFEYDQNSAGVSRDLIVRALRAEGIPVGTGYPRLLHMHPMFLRKIAFGRGGWPFCLNRDVQNYSRGLCPVAEELAGNRLITFAAVHRPCGEADMKDVADAFQKVFGQLDALREIEKDRK